MVTLEIAAPEFVRRFQAGEIPGDARVVVTYQADENAAALALIERRLAQTPTDPKEIQEAEDDLLELQQALNATRREAGARILYPDIPAP